MTAFGSVDRKAIEEVVQSVVDHGFDPAKVVSCVPSAGLPGSIKGVRGCNMYDRCPFHLARYGGFKGFWRPKNVGYYYKPNDGTNHQKEDFLVCHQFVHTQMDRKLASDAAISQNKPGEFIDIIAQEGENITTKVWGPDPKHPTYGTPNPKFTYLYSTFPVPEYAHPADHEGDSYEAKLERKRISRQREEQPVMGDLPGRMLTDSPRRLEVDEDDDDRVNQLAAEEWSADKK